MCPIEITYYPFDTQNCNLQFGAWSYYTSKMNLTTLATQVQWQVKAINVRHLDVNDIRCVMSLQVSRDTYEENGEWEIIGSEVTRHEFYFDCCPDQKFSNLNFRVHLRRRHTFYIMNVILPGIMTSAVLLSIFFCTPSQKVHIGVAALLSFRLFLLNVADTIPRTSDHVPLLGIYLTSTMAITTLAMVATVFVLNLYNKKDEAVPQWVNRVVVTYMARILCMCECVAPAPGDRSSHGSRDDIEMNLTHANEYALQTNAAFDSSTHARHRKSLKQRLNKGHKYSRVNTSDAPATIESNPHARDRNAVLFDANAPSTATNQNRDCYQSHYYIQNGEGVGDTQLSQTATDRSHRQHNQPQPQPLQQQQSTERRRRQHKTQEQRQLEYSKDWVHVAAVCDRLFFWFCLIFITVTTLMLFHPLTTSRFFQIPMLEKHPPT